MTKLDLKKDLKHLYAPSARKVEIVNVPRFQFAMIDGAIEAGKEPGTSPGFSAAIQALYGISYTLKFMLKKRAVDPVEYPVMPLEGLLWVAEGSFFDIRIKDNWRYTLMILQPDIVTQDEFEQGRAEVRRKRGDTEALARLRLEAFEEGLCVQTMHIGPYAAEPATVERLRAFAMEHGYVDCVGFGGKHHEIYLGDPRKADAAKLKTVLRHPIRLK